MYYSAIGLLAILVLVIVNRDILWSRKVFDKPAWNVYRRFLYAVLAYYVVDVLWGYLEYKKFETALFVDTTIYFITMASGLSFWAEFIVLYLDEKNTFGRALIYAGRAISGLMCGLTIINIFIPLIFTVDSSCVYTALPLRYVMLVCQILFLIVLSLFSLSSMIGSRCSYEEGMRFRITASFGIIMAVFLFVQLWFPYLPLYSIAYMLGSCMLHSFVVVDEKEEYLRKIDEAKKVSETKDRFFSLLNNMPGLTFTKDAETGIYLACNQAFAEYAQKDAPEGVVGHTAAQIFDAKTAIHFAEDDKIALSLGKPYIYVDDITDTAGNPRQFQTTKIKYRDTEGRLCILGFCQDITDQLSIQHEHALTREAYESAVKTGLLYNHIAQTLARDYTEMFYVNTDTEEFTEYRRVEESSTLSELQHGWHFFSDCRAQLSEDVYPDDREAFLSALNRKKLMKALSVKDTFVMTYRRSVMGRPVYYSMKISRIEKDEQYIIIGFTDVDAEIGEAMARNKALNDALNAAEAANRSRTEFLSGMSHDIRTPINAIIGLDTLALKSDSLSSGTREYLEKIGDSAQQLLSMINDILVMSRIESGREILHNGKFSVDDMLGQVNSQAMKMCGEKGIEYEFIALNKPDAAYIGDDKKLQAVLLNILSNAVRNGGKAGKVTMTAEKTGENNGQVTLCFCISNTGEWIDKEDIPKIFDAFSAEDAGIGSQYGRNGLGIAVTKKIVEMMNGAISITSEKGAGTKFTVTVTLLKGDGNDTVLDEEIDTSSMFILIVDDNPIEAEHAEMVLKEAGIRADVCTSGQEALRRIEVQHTKKDPYSMILMDWNMPGMNGRETSAEILRQYEKESLVVAMTAYSWDDIRDEAQSVGVDDYLEKPLFASNVIMNLKRIARQNNMAVFKSKKRARLEGRRILLAEDVMINAEILMNMLEMENIKADHAENGKVAVDLFGNSTAGIYSAILMDVRMPVMDGLEAARTIRSMDREDAKRIPIIALTANAFDEDVRLSLQAGMNAHLNKPVEMENLIRILGELIYEADQSITLGYC